jgi:E3 ubiquitin-protein ligase RFWD2
MEGESSVGALVLTVNSEATISKMPPPTEELDKDMFPICMQIIKDASVTSCGHSFLMPVEAKDCVEHKKFDE